MPGRQAGVLPVLCWLTMAAASTSSRSEASNVAEMRGRFFRALLEHLGLSPKRDLPAVLTERQREAIYQLCMAIFLDPELDARTRQLAKVVAELATEAAPMPEVLKRAEPELSRLTWDGAMALPPEERLRLNKARADVLGRARKDVIERPAGRRRGRPENPRTSIEADLRAQEWELEEIVPFTDRDAGDPVKRVRGRTDAWDARMSKEARELEAEARRESGEDQVKQIARDSEP